MTYTHYSGLGSFWTLLMIAGFLIWLFLAFHVYADLFRRHEISGWTKVAWVVGIVLFPYLGVLVYLVSQHTGMNQRSISAQRDARAALATYVQHSAGTHTGASEIATAKRLHDEGTLTDDEFDALKAKILA